MRLRLIVRRNPSQISGLASLRLRAVQSFRDGQCNTEKILYNTKQKSRTNRILLTFVLLFCCYIIVYNLRFTKKLCATSTPQKPLRDF